MIRQISAIAWKDLKILFKDTGGIFWLFLMPVLFIFVMTAALGNQFSSGGDSPFNILVVNEDSGPAGAQLVAGLKSSGGFDVETEWDSAPLTREKAEQLIVSKERNIAVIIPADFSATIQQGAFGATGGGPPKRAQITLVVDPALSLQFVGPVKGALAGLSQQAMMFVLAPRGIEMFLDQVDQTLGTPVPPKLRKMLQERAAQGTSMGAGMDSLVEIKETQPAGMAIESFPNSTQQNVPGYTLFGLFFISGVLATSILEEKQVGTFRRLLAAPLSRTAFLLGKLTPYVFVNLVQVALMFAVGVFLMPLIGAPALNLGRHPEALVLISVVTSLSATGLGLLLAALAKTHTQVGGLGALLAVIMAALGGVMVPRFVMPQFMQTLGLITPHAWALDAYQDVLVRGYGLGHIWPGIAALTGFAVLFFGVALWQFSWD
ncbi:MAG: ABC transporter permease [Chloroflexi bacterium]|nr:ABC transporter permease [Chloroflexota bacterium]